MIGKTLRAMKIPLMMISMMEVIKMKILFERFQEEWNLSDRDLGVEYISIWFSINISFSSFVSIKFVAFVLFLWFLAFVES